MARFTDIFIKRPVLSTVVALLILLVGLKSLTGLQIRQYPKMDNAVITITTSYPGASAKLVAGFITSPIEKAIAGADGVDYISSQSALGLSTITAHIKLNFSTQEAFTNVSSKVAQVKAELPKEALAPVIEKGTGRTVSLLYVAYSSKSMSPEQITDYLSRVVQPKIETVSGVSQAQILGKRPFAMRIWLNPTAMAGYGVTATDVVNALKEKNFLSQAGSTWGAYTAINVAASTSIDNPKDFGNIIIKTDKNQLVRLKDVAKVELGSQYYNANVIFNGQKAIFLAIDVTPTANPLTVITSVRKVLKHLAPFYPASLKANVVYDATGYIRDSIKEVLITILEAAVIVILVILAFLGSLRTTAIPMITIPLSLIGVCSFMLAMNYSINLLTLLAMVLAIGMVVDDAIVVVENIFRHIELGKAPREAAIQGAREIAFPVIAMTLTLIAVYAPIGFMQGVTGALFTEFAFTLAGAVAFSGVIALLVSPMMCSRFLGTLDQRPKYERFVERTFDHIKAFYGRRLRNVLKYRSVMYVMAVVVLGSCYFLYAGAAKQLAPTEDESVLFAIASAPVSANFDYVKKFSHQYEAIYKKTPQIKDYFIINGIGPVSKVITGMILKPWGDRKLSQQQVFNKLTPEMGTVAGLQTQLFQMPPLPGGGIFPIDFVLTTTGSYQSLYKAAEKLSLAADESGKFIFAMNSLKFDQPSDDFVINRAKAAQLGISITSIGSALGYGLSGAYINHFEMNDQSYQVIPQLYRPFRRTVHQLLNMQVKTASGALVPLSTVVSIKHTIEPSSLSHFQQLNSASIQGILRPGVSIAQGLQFMREQAEKLPQDISYNYAGTSRQFMQEGDSLMFTFIFSLIVIYLVLAAQFESFTDPVIILVSVPMSICGALIPLNLGLASINIYTQIGLITLIGLISKHGILMVEFANKLQEDENLSILEAIILAAKTRLRAILMTTFAMIFGVVPLLTAVGAGAHSRFDIGLVIAAGMLIGTGFTLFIVPTMYTLMARRHKKID